tara:strand:+ start:3388 stop:3525 length:138 start_codon:yes stop_codon:yes gene_type:complete
VIDTCKKLNGGQAAKSELGLSYSTLATYGDFSMPVMLAYTILVVK